VGGLILLEKGKRILSSQRRRHIIGERYKYLRRGKKLRFGKISRRKNSISRGEAIA